MLFRLANPLHPSEWDQRGYFHSLSPFKPFTDPITPLCTVCSAFFPLMVQFILRIATKEAAGDEIPQKGKDRRGEASRKSFQSEACQVSLIGTMATCIGFVG